MPNGWRRLRRRILAGCGMVLLLAGSGTNSPGADEPVRPGGFTSEQARARMTLPPGFTVSVFASEPMVRQPVAACFDERGRLWVIEYLQYPNPAGLKPVTVDQYLRTEYDRVPEPPPNGPRGVDRIKILEDTDSDGKADKATVFVEGLNLASALAVGHGGVFVGQAPYLLFYPDRDRDDRPDGDPEVRLSGFGLQDAHATVNSMTWGPDGWLYGAQGSTVTARIRGIEFQQGIWRYHPRDRRFELFAEGGGNTWGLDFDLLGNAFGSSNGGFVAFHMVQGGYYWKGFAKHGPLHNPNTFGYFNSLEYQGTKVGGHVTPGGIIYKGDALPESYRGAFLGGNLLANAVYRHDLTSKGSTFTARHGETVIDSHDTWFRPIDLLTGPDGSVYVVDWYDKRASHLDPRDNWDRTNGRIYRLDSKERRRVEPFDLSKKTSAELVAFRTATNDWFAAEARRILAERRDDSIVSWLRRSLIGEADPVRALRDLWMIHVSGGFDDATARSALGHPVADVRRWAIRLLGDDARAPEPIRARLVELAESDPDPKVRSQLASSCRRWPGDIARPILGRLMARSEDVDDTHVPLLIWWALERQARDARAETVALVMNSRTQALPLVRTHLLERLARLLAERGRDDDWKTLAEALTAAPGEPERARLRAGMAKALEGPRLATVPAPLAEAVEGLVSGPSGTFDPERIQLAIRLGSATAYGQALLRIIASDAPEAERRALVELVGQVRDEAGRDVLLGLLRKGAKSSPTLRSAALAALGGYAEPGVADAILAAYESLAPPARTQAIALLCGRPTWTMKLLDAIESKRVPAADLRPVQAQQLARLGDSHVLARLEQVWGKVPQTGSAEKVRRIAEVRGMLPEGDKGNADRGRLVFREVCAGCHRLFGEGEAIGPELTGAERHDLDFLLTSLVDPNSVIRKEYQGQTVALKDGRILSGLVVEESAATLTLFDAQKRKTVLPKGDIEDSRPAAGSLMPEGLLDPLSDAQVRDLFRYLQSAGPRP